MKVQQLIEKLQKFDPDLRVEVTGKYNHIEEGTIWLGSDIEKIKKDKHSNVVEIVWDEIL